MRWLAAGAALGGLTAAVLFAPASWLAAGLSAASGERLLLADARGTVWNGSAIPVLTGGPGSRDAAALPGRLAWRIRPEVGRFGIGLGVRADQPCCLARALRLLVVPGLGTLRVELQVPAAEPGVTPVLGQWPAAWLVGLGTPWNTLQPGGALQLASPGLAVETARGRWRFSGRADVELNAFASRMSTLDVLGSYRLTVDAGGGGETARLTLDTTAGPLLLSGSGQFGGGGLRFHGSASAAPGHEAVLNNLLNIIGRRQGAQALISIG